jgi:MSHA pilin protein MshA
MVRSQKGFTIIELVVVIVILGILAAVAFPRFQDLSGTARTAVLNGGIAAFKSAAVLTRVTAAGVPTFASVNANTVSDGVSFTGPCPTVTATYTPDPTVTSTFTMDTGFCNN